MADRGSLMSSVMKYNSSYCFLQEQSQNICVLALHIIRLLQLILLLFN